MNLFQRLLFAFVLAAGVALGVKIFIAAFNTQSAIIFTLLLTGLVFPMVSLYSNKTLAILNDRDGNPIPKYMELTKRRDKIGKLFAMIGIIGVFINLIFGILFPELSYRIYKNYESILIIPLIISLIVGVYFSFTNQCPYCCKFNIPNDSNCCECGNPLFKTWLNNYAKQRETGRKEKED